MYSLNWIVENRILLLRNEGTLTGAEVKALSHEFETMMATAVAPLHVIEDDRALKSLSDISLDGMRQTLRALDMDKLETAVAIMPDALEEVTDLLGKAWELFSDIDYYRAETLPEALDYLAKHDATLPDRSEWRLEFA